MTASAEAERQPDLTMLLRALTAAAPGWGVWKNADAALAGFGDVDSAAPRSEWPAIEATFAEWARAQGLGPVVACPHVPDGLFLLALDQAARAFVELDVAGSQPLRGHALFRAGSLAPLMQLDPRGFRRLRPGAEGLVLLLLSGLRHFGRPNPERLAARRIPELLALDPEGVREAARLLGVAGPAALALADAVRAGRWHRGAALAVELRGAVLSPPSLPARARYRLVWTRCPVNVAIRGGRRLPADVDGWLATVAEDRRHRVIA